MRGHRQEKGKNRTYMTNTTYKNQEEDFIMLSALQHFVFCPRQCALIHIEQVWDENLFTAEGRLMHERVHEAGDESRGNVKIARGLPLRSSQLGLVGIADVVEFYKIDKNRWQPFPVEYKRGKPKPDHSDKIQLCAQAICLEEMLNVGVPKGAIFYGRTRRRLDVAFDDALRKETEEAATKAHELVKSEVTPPPVYTKRCESCSLLKGCMPKDIEKSSPVKHYLRRMVDTL